MPIWRRNHGLAAAEGIRERTRGDLSLVQIWGDVDVRSAQEALQFLEFDELVEEAHVLGNPRALGQSLQTLAVDLSVLAYQVGMRRAQHDVYHVGIFRHDRRQSFDHFLDALV